MPVRRYIASLTDGGDLAGTHGYSKENRLPFQSNSRLRAGFRLASGDLVGSERVESASTDWSRHKLQSVRPEPPAGSDEDFKVKTTSPNPAWIRQLRALGRRATPTEPVERHRAAGQVI